MIDWDVRNWLLQIFRPKIVNESFLKNLSLFLNHVKSIDSGSMQIQSATGQYTVGSWKLVCIWYGKFFGQCSVLSELRLAINKHMVLWAWFQKLWHYLRYCLSLIISIWPWNHTSKRLVSESDITVVLAAEGTHFIYSTLWTLGSKIQRIVS